MDNIISQYYFLITRDYPVVLFLYYYSKASKYPNNQFDLRKTFMRDVFNVIDPPVSGCLKDKLDSLVKEKHIEMLMNTNWYGFLDYLKHICAYNYLKFNYDAYYVLEEYYRESIISAIEKSYKSGVLTTNNIGEFLRSLF